MTPEEIQRQRRKRRNGRRPRPGHKAAGRAGSKQPVQVRSQFQNREWSWLRFNERVLEEAEDGSSPLLERVKFLAIFASNLDEFFKVRVAGLYRQMEAGIEASGADRRSPLEQIEGISRMVRELVPRQERALDRLMRRLAEEGIRILGAEGVDQPQRAYLDRYYREVVYPVITPMIVGPTHPFPALQDCAFYLILMLGRPRKKGGQKRLIAFIGLPRVLPRFIALSRAQGSMDLVPLESLLVTKVKEIFSGYNVQSVSAARVTRDADIIIDEEAVEDFRKALARKILGRRHGAAVRLEYGTRMEPALLSTLQARLELDPLQRYPQGSLMQPCDLAQIYDLVDRPELKVAPLLPLEPPGSWAQDIFQWILDGPRLLHHPYHTFDPVAELVSQAANDPGVLAIKQTLYRTSGHSPVVRALTRAAEKGKHVTAVVELRARFDEERNIDWAQRLEQAGAHVVYGLVGYKTHCKVLLVVRREEDGIRRYIHFGTGNYNDATARIYTDLGLMVADERLGQDASALFNMITGATQPPDWNRVQTSPTGLRRSLLHLIERERDKSTGRSRGQIRAKMNSLVDREIIEALYAASQAGVRIDLIVRGICCLRAGVQGLSENIRVVSIVGRFLEHSRIFYFKNGGQEEVYISSADWMPRNLDHRVELMVPVDHPEHRRYLWDLLELQLRDNVKARQLLPDGRYERVKRRNRSIDSQAEVYDLTRRSLGESEASPTEGRLVPLGAPRDGPGGAEKKKTRRDGPGRKGRMARGH